MEEWERKAHARARREHWRNAKGGFDTRTRWVAPEVLYRRNFKHAPKSVDDWEGVE
jgi:hypothetical protein